MDNPKYISEEILQFARDSEELEGFTYDLNNISTDSDNLMKDISKDVVVEFLKCPDTKIMVVKNIAGDYEVLAHNLVANETVRIKDMGNHFMALVRVGEEVNDYKKRKETDPNTPLIRNNFPENFPKDFAERFSNEYSSDFIKEVNEQLLLHRYGEIGIGDYRTIDFTGRPVDVMIADNIDGRLVNKNIKLERSANGNVVLKMKELIDWVNDEGFKDNDPEKILENVAKFHSRFIEIHPFRDGNGRTARLLTNYLLMAKDMPLINIPAKDRKDYIDALNYSILPEDAKLDGDYTVFCEKMRHTYGDKNDENKFFPLRDFFADHLLPNSNELVEEIIDYKGGTDSRKMSAEQVEGFAK